MKTALYFGSFDPPHIYHDAIINHLLEHEGFDEVTLVVSPQSPHKTDVTRFIYRALMCVAASKKYKGRCHVSPIEENMPTPSYTIDTLREFKKISFNEFSIVMGMDNWLKIYTWKEWKTIVENYPIIVIPRNSCRSDFQFDKTIEVFNKKGAKINPMTRMIETLPTNNISSTFIRNEIKNGKNVSPYLNDEVYKFIKSKNLYK